MVKENLLKFDGSRSSRNEWRKPSLQALGRRGSAIKEVTDYVREEFNRAEALANEKQAGTVGFALTILQRRLASSPKRSTNPCGAGANDSKAGCASSSFYSAELE